MKATIDKSLDAEQASMRTVAKRLSERQNSEDILNIFRRDQDFFKSAVQAVKEKHPGFSGITIEQLSQGHEILLKFLQAVDRALLVEINQRLLEPCYVVSEPPPDVVEQIARRVTAYALTFHKTDSTKESNEDAFFIEKNNVYRKDIIAGKTYAVADGATSSPDAQQWAQTLSKNSAKYKSRRADFLLHLPDVQKEWAVSWEARKKSTLQATTSWWAETALDKPNAATYCSITLLEAEPSSPLIPYRAIAIGDSCLFHFRHGHLLKSFPVDSPLGFTDRPQLVRSSGDITRGGDVAEIEGSLQKGDTIVLATDAVAEWILKWQLQGSSIMGNIILGNINEIGFCDLIERERQGGRMKDDDSTIVVVGVR